MRSILGLVVALVVSGCQCGGPVLPCDGVMCGSGLVCAPETGRCVSKNAVDAGMPVADAGESVDAGPCGVVCSGATPVCNVMTRECAVCAESSDCPTSAPICVTTLVPQGECFQCRDVLDCFGNAICDAQTHRCVTIDAGTDLNEPVVYGHTATTLYKVNATTKVVTAVADFHNCNSDVIDLALDQYSRAFVTTVDGLFRLDLTNGNCTAINGATTNTYPNSLSFVPKGTLDPTVEALVGYSGSSYVRINVVTGAIQQLGTLGGGFVSSGDIVSVIDGGTYLTAKNVNGSSDFLLEVNPANGSLVRSLGPLPFNDVFGLAFWGGSLYGFSNGGTLFEITITGTGTTSMAVPNAMSHTWNGAGSTTAAALR